MKDLAKHMARARVKPRPRHSQQERGEAPNPPPPTMHPTQGVVGEIPDTWDPKHRPDLESRARQARKELEEAKEASNGDDGYEVVPRVRIKKDKRRRNTLSIAVSDEEEAVIRAHLAKTNSSFSAWARSTLFRAMGKKIPARPKKE